MRGDVANHCANAIGIGDVERPGMCAAPPDVIASDTAAIPSAEISVTATLAPSSPKTRAVARPMPLCSARDENGEAAYRAA